MWLCKLESRCEEFQIPKMRLWLVSLHMTGGSYDYFYMSLAILTVNSCTQGYRYVYMCKSRCKLHSYVATETS